jgi:hypothetical protein
MERKGMIRTMKNLDRNFTRYRQAVWKKSRPITDQPGGSSTEETGQN